MNDKKRRLKRLEQSFQPKRKHFAYSMREIEESLTPEERRAYEDEIEHIALKADIKALLNSPYEEFERHYPTIAAVHRRASEAS
jgi:hypothetical protein